MKIYEIRNKKLVFGYLYSDDKYENYYIDIVKGLDHYPIFFDLFVRKNKYTINNDWSKKWVMERIIPYERQNINDILKENKLKNYNALELFIKCGGRSSMDDNYLKIIKDIEIKNKREEKIIKDFIKIRNNKIIVFYKNETRLFDYHDHIEDKPFLSILGNEIIFNSKYRFDYELIKNKGKKIDFRYEDLISFLNDNIMNAKEVENELAISKQSVYNLKNNRNIVNLNNHLFLKNNIKTFK